MSNENLTEKTLADVKAGIPARDAEIETLRKENAELREQLEAIGAGGVSGKLMPGADTWREVIIDNGPWHTGVTSDGRHYLESDEFTHDVRLYIDGDFASDDDKARYAKGIAGQINGNLMPVAVSAEPVAEFAESFIFVLRHQDNGDRWPVGTKLYAAPVAAQVQPITPADAVYGLLAWLSCRDEVVTLSARHGAAIASDLANAFCEANGLQQFSPDYPENLKYPKSTLKQQPVSGADQFRDAAQMIEPSGNSGELPRLPLNDPAAAYRVLHDYGQSCARAALAQSPMVDMTPPATARDRWMYEQGRLAERDPRNPGTLAQQDAALHAEVLNMVLMLEANEWADHCGKSDLGRRLEWAITVLQNRIAELTKSSNQQDADNNDELFYKLGCFIDYATGGRLSNLNWPLATLKQSHDENLEALIAERIKEAKEDEQDFDKVDAGIEAAAKALAECMDYPWEPMPEQGRDAMRKHVKTIIDAARKEQE